MDIEKTFNSFQIKSIYIKGHELFLQAISSMNIYEGIIYPGILGEIQIADWQGFSEVGEVFAMDDIEITFASVDRPDIKMNFKIYASSTSMQPTTTYNPISYKFCSPWLVDAFTRAISKSFKDKFIHEIVKDLLTECGATIGFIEPTKQKLEKFTTPLWTPLKSISHLLSFALNTQDMGGYVFWTDLVSGKVNVTTMDYLYSGKFGKEDVKFKPLPLNDLYEGRVMDLTVETNFDVIKSVNQGLQNTKYQSYFIDKNKLYTSEKKVNEIPQTHLSNKLPINNLFLDNKYCNIKHSFLYPISENLVSDDNDLKNLIDGKANTRYTKLFSDTIRMTFRANANVSRRSGNICELEYQSAEKTFVTDNKLYSGKYLIRNIRHYLQGSAFLPIITIINDGYQETKLDLVTWKKDK